MFAIVQTLFCYMVILVWWTEMLTRVKSDVSKRLQISGLWKCWKWFSVGIQNCLHNVYLCTLRIVIFKELLNYIDFSLLRKT